MAQFSGSSNYTQPEEVDISSFADQIEKVITEAGLSVEASTMADSRWLIENEIPLTGENLKYLEEIKNMQFPLDSAMVIAGITEALTEGGSATDALLIPGHRLYEQAQDAMKVVENATEQDADYIVDRGMELTIENLREAEANRGVAGSSEAAAGTEHAPVNQSVAGSSEAADTERAPENQSAGNSAANTGTAENQTAPGAAADAYTQSGLDRLTARRQLEETRLAMTVEANYALLKRGISIDTEPLVSLIDQLKSNEEEYYVNLLKAQGLDDAQEKASLLMETTEKIAGIKTVPAYVLGIRQADVSTIEGIHREGTRMADEFRHASEQYETLMTKPEKELGDSIEKAFQNVDDILKDTGLELTEENRRAVRILAYNQTPITEENVTQMKAADEEVQRAFKNLTPAVVTRMIKDGINPLEMDMKTLNQTAENIKEEIGDTDATRFSEYLWKLEQSHSISEEERSSYIGIYRLIRQVENTDGAAIGAVVNQGAELSMKNLLTAVRSGNRSGKMNVTVDDSFGEISQIEKSGLSITEQVEAAYQFNCLKDVLGTITPNRIREVMEANPDWQDMTPEQLKSALESVESEELAQEEQKLDTAYARTQLAEFSASAQASQDVYEILEKYDIPNTSLNILAMDEMVKNRNQIFRRIFGAAQTTDSGENTGAEETEDLLSTFAEALKDPEELKQAQQKLNDFAEKQMEEQIEQDGITSLDVRGMKLLHTQLAINTSLAKQEQYSVPVRIDDEIIHVSLKIVRDADTKGTVDVSMEHEQYGKIAATFQAKADGVNGLIVSDKPETKAALESVGEQLAESISDGETELRFAEMKDLDLDHFGTGAFGVHAKNAAEAAEDEQYQVQTARLYQIAENFIRLLREQL
jgi:hypothetical protein